MAGLALIKTGGDPGGKVATTIRCGLGHAPFAGQPQRIAVPRGLAGQIGMGKPVVRPAVLCSGLVIAGFRPFEHQLGCIYVRANKGWITSDRHCRFAAGAALAR